MKRSLLSFIMIINLFNFNQKVEAISYKSLSNVTLKIGKRCLNGLLGGSVIAAGYNAIRHGLKHYKTDEEKAYYAHVHRTEVMPVFLISSIVIALSSCKLIR